MQLAVAVHVALNVHMDVKLIVILHAMEDVIEVVEESAAIAKVHAQYALVQEEPLASYKYLIIISQSSNLEVNDYENFKKRIRRKRR